MNIAIYDTILRDGAQGEGINFSVTDKLAITELLDDLGVAYIEGGWPGSNPKDETYFKKVARLKLHHARLAAFGATCRAGVHCDDDPSIQALLKSGVPTVTIFGKSWKFHATHALKITPEENIDLISRTIEYLKARVDEVIYDAEHFFDGFADDEAYALSTLEAAATADYVVLCDTNGGALAADIERGVKETFKRVSCPIGIHTHNDSDMAVANSITAVLAGATMVQGTLNGYGERCGNANLISIIPTLELKAGYKCLPDGNLSLLTKMAHAIDEIANRQPLVSQPFVGRSAFAHKGGVHANAVMKDRRTYEHIDPDKVGNSHRILLSDLSGQASVLMKARELGVELESDDPAIPRIVERLKKLESEGFQFEGADASFKLLVDRVTGRHPTYFTLHNIDLSINISNPDSPDEPDFTAEATAIINLEVGEVRAQTKASGEGPVNAIDMALRKLIDKFYPSLKEVSLLDYKVRVLNGGAATASVVRVLIRSGDGKEDWGTVGVSSNIIEASWLAMVDALEYKLVKDGVAAHE